MLVKISRAKKGRLIPCYQMISGEKGNKNKEKASQVAHRDGTVWLRLDVIGKSSWWCGSSFFCSIMEKEKALAPPSNLVATKAFCWEEQMTMLS